VSLLNGNAERLANNVGLLLAARLAQVIGIPVLLGVMGWMAHSMIEVKAQLAGFAAWTVAAERESSAQDRRIERVEDRLNTLARTGR
jgi:hypothetical protein